MSERFGWDGYYFSKVLAQTVAREFDGELVWERNAETGFCYWVYRKELWPGELTGGCNCPGKNGVRRGAQAQDTNGDKAPPTG